MPDWSRRSLLAALGLAGVAGGGWHLREQTRCGPLVAPQWTYTGRRRVTDALFHRDGFYVAAEWWTRPYPVEG